MGAVVRSGFEVAIAGEVEGLEDLVIIGIGAVTDDFLDLIDFEVDGAGAIGNDVEFGKSIEERDGIEPLGKEVHDRSAEELEGGRVDAILERRLGIAEKNDQIDLIAVAFLENRAQSGELEKEEPLGSLCWKMILGRKISELLLSKRDSRLR